MIPTLARPGEVAPGQFGPMSRAPPARTTSTALSMSRAGIPSVMQKIVAIPAPTASSTASGAPLAGTKMQDVSAPVSRTASATVSKTGTRPSRAVWPPLLGVTPATIGVPYSSIWRAWNSPSRPVIPWTTRRVSRPTRMLTTPPPSPPRRPSRPRRRGWPRSRSGPRSRSRAASSAFVPTIRTTIGTSRSWTARASMSPRATSSPRVIPPKMLTRIARTFGSARMRRIAAATLSARAPPPMSRKLAGSPPARLTRSIVVIARPAPLTMQPIVPSSLMKVRPSSRAARSVGSSSSRSRRASWPGCRAERRVVEGDLRVEADEALGDGPVGARLADDRQRVDLDEVGVVRQHRRDQALGDRPRSRAGSAPPRPIAKASERACQSSSPRWG